MKSHFECIDELDIIAAEVHRSRGAPDHAIGIGGLDLDYAMDSGRLLYRPEGTPQAELGPALELTLSGARGVHCYALSREAQLVIVQPHELPLRKQEVRKPKRYQAIETSRELGGFIGSAPFSVVTITGLRRLTAEMAQFKEQSALPALSQ